MNKKALLSFIEKQRKIYKDIYDISKELGPTVADPLKYLGKLEALVELEYFIKAGDFDAEDELSKYEAFLKDDSSDLMKIWNKPVSKSLPSESEINDFLLNIFAPKKKSGFMSNSQTPGDKK